MLLLAGVAVILVATLALPGSRSPRMEGCLICGTVGVADAVRNVILFLPLGVGLARVGGPLWLAVGLSLALSGGVELVQTFLPGRDGSAGDLLFNGLGGALGFALAVLFAARPPRWASLVWSLFVVLIFAGTAWLLVPEPPPGRYFVFHMPQLGHLAASDAEVLEARLSGVPIRPGWLSDARTLERALFGGQELALRLRPGSSTEGLAGWFAVYNDMQEEVFLLGRSYDDLVVRVARRADRLALDRPDMRARGRFPRAGDGAPVGIRLALRRGRARVAIDDGPFLDLGIELARGWSTLLYPAAAPEPLLRLLDLGWLVVLFAPIGWLGGWSRWSGIGVGLAAGGLVGVPALGFVAPTPAPWVLAALSAWGVAAWLASRSPTVEMDATERRPSRPGAR